MSSYIATCLERSADLAEWLYGQNVGVGKWMDDSPQTVMTTSRPHKGRHQQKKTFSFEHCPNHLNPPLPDPNSGNLVLFFRTLKF